MTNPATGDREPTPGPWNCFYKTKYDEWHVSLPMSRGSMRLALFPDGIQSENREADARLIAAAPEMLAALEKARQFIVNGVELGFIRMPDDSTPDPAHETLPAIEAALSLAQGKKP